ncbi:MAG: PH domain-containing protein [Singulisphaera sp.]
MADYEPVPTPKAPTSTSNQVNTTDLNVTPLADSAQPDRLYPQGSSPVAAAPAPVDAPQAGSEKANTGAGVEGEETVWEGRYAMKNFLGRIAFRVLLTVAWIVLAGYTWGYGHEKIQILTILAGIALVLIWVALFYRIAQARYGHYYRLTTRRLFVSTGLYKRRRDQVELIKVSDVFTEQKLIERWLAVGTVVVKSSEAASRRATWGVNDPKEVMNIVWHYARAERDHRSVMVDRV